MKKRLLLVFIFTFIGIYGFTEIDPAVARLKLTRVEVITRKQLKDKIEQFEKVARTNLTAAQKEQILNNLIDTKLLLQAADRDNIRVSQAEIDAMIELYKQQVAAQTGLTPNMTNNDLELILKQQDVGLPWETFIAQITEQLKVRNYIQKDQLALFQAVPRPTDEEIQSFFDANRKSFVLPDMVRFKQIVIRTQGLNADDAAKAKKMADEIFRELENGASFDKYQEIFLEESRSLIGGISFETWQRDDQRKPVEYGKAYFNSLFKMTEGTRSQVLKSNFGYHIIKIIEKIPFSVLGLDDKIPPLRVITVRDYIADGLFNNKNNEVFQKATAAAVAKLKEEAEIKIFEENFPF